MFNLFGNKKPIEAPVDEEMRQWIDNALLWLMQQFGEENLKSKKVLSPDYTDFPIKYTGQNQSALDTLKIIARQMEINADEIELEIYSEGQTEINTGNVFDRRMFMGAMEDEEYTAGLYWGRQENNKYYIGLEEKNLKDPIKLVATLAHEISHIKLLGENKIEENNEPLTDLTTVVFGFGIFNANAAFQIHQGFDRWERSTIGYLSQMEWGYALALYAYLRGEESPSWINHLSKNVKADFIKSEKFIRNNEDKLFLLGKNQLEE